MKIDYQAEIWKQNCPRPKCGSKGKGKMTLIRRVRKTDDGVRHAQVVCGSCDSFMELHFKVHGQ